MFRLLTRDKARPWYYKQLQHFGTNCLHRTSFLVSPYNNAYYLHLRDISLNVGVCVHVRYFTSLIALIIINIAHIPTHAYNRLVLAVSSVWKLFLPEIRLFLNIWRGLLLLPCVVLLVVHFSLKQNIHVVILV